MSNNAYTPTRAHISSPILLSPPAPAPALVPSHAHIDHVSRTSGELQGDHTRGAEGEGRDGGEVRRPSEG